MACRCANSCPSGRLRRLTPRRKCRRGGEIKAARLHKQQPKTYYESIISRLALLKLSAALKVIWAEFRRIKALRKLDEVNIFRALLKWRGVVKKKGGRGGCTAEGVPFKSSEPGHNLSACVAPHSFTAAFVPSRRLRLHISFHSQKAV